MDPLDALALLEFGSNEQQDSVHRLLRERVAVIDAQAAGAAAQAEREARARERADALVATVARELGYEPGPALRGELLAKARAEVEAPPEEAVAREG